MGLNHTATKEVSSELTHFRVLSIDSKDRSTYVVPGDQKALFHHPKPRSQNLGTEATRGKAKPFQSPETTWLRAINAHV